MPPQGQALWRGCPVGTEAPALATCPQILPPASRSSGEACSNPCSSQAHPRVFWKTTAGGRGRERPFLSAASQWVTCSCFPAFQMKKSFLVEIVQITSQRLEIKISTAEGSCFLKNTSLARPLSVPPTLTASMCARGGGLRFQQGLPGFFKFPFLSSLR